MLIITVGAPYQPCWGCGEQAGGLEDHFYHGNFPFGIEHGSCGERISIILDRSFRALEALAPDSDAQTCETVKRALITTAARKLDNKPLKEISDEQQIRSAVEKKGMKAARKMLRAISNIDSNTWKTRLEKHDQIMKGPEIVQKELSEEDKTCLKQLIIDCMRMKRENREGQLAALACIKAQVMDFKERRQRQENTAPYCIIKDAIGQYHRHEDEHAGLTVENLLKEIEALEAWKVLFLGKKVQDGSYKYITHITVEHIAFLPAKTPIEEARKVWQKEYSCQDKSGQADVFPLDCLTWENHWVYVREINKRLDDN